MEESPGCSRDPIDCSFNQVEVTVQKHIIAKQTIEMAAQKHILAIRDTKISDLQMEKNNLVREVVQTNL